jgi:PAS domain S-box-containing protein
MSNKKILIVEDEVIIAEDIRMMVEKCGYDVCGMITTGESAVKEAEEIDPDLVLMDIMLGKSMNGMQAAQEINKTLNVPFIFITAYADDDTIEKSLHVDPYGYIVKPFDERELKASLELAFYKFKMEKILKASEEKYKLIFNNIQDVYLELDLYGKILEISPSIQSFTSHIRENVINKNIGDLLENQQAMEKLLANIMQYKQLHDYEIALSSGNNKIIPCSISCRLILEKLNNKEKIICSLRDISHRKKLEKKVLRTERLAGVGQLAAGIAHEIRNPLGNISSSIQFCLRKYDIPVNLKQYLEIIQRNSENANKIIKELLEFATPRDIKLEPILIQDVLENAISLVEARCEQSGVVVSKNFCSNIPELLIDANWMQQAFVNFFINAVDAMPNGGEIKIECSYNNDEVMISFCDNGDGISDKNLNKIFDPFFTTKSEGTGLGLSLVYQIISAHNGTIDIVSEVGKGTCVNVKLTVKEGRN